MRQALLLSITVHPASAKRGAHSSEVPPPALNSAISGRAATASSISITGTCFPRKCTVAPTLRALATGSSSRTGKPRSSSTFSMTPPTSPVAPTTATFMTNA